MTHYRTSDGLLVSAGTSRELLEKLWKKSFSPTETLEGFCAECAQRIEDQQGLSIRNPNPESVLNALLASGLIEEVGEGEDLS